VVEGWLKIGGAYNSDPSGSSEKGTNMSWKKSVATRVKLVLRSCGKVEEGDLRVMPSLDWLAMRPTMVSPLNGRNTIMRNSTVLRVSERADFYENK